MPLDFLSSRKKLRNVGSAAWGCFGGTGIQTALSSITSKRDLSTVSLHISLTGWIPLRGPREGFNQWWGGGSGKSPVSPR